MNFSNILSFFYSMFIETTGETEKKLYFKRFNETLEFLLYFSRISIAKQWILIQCKKYIDPSSCGPMNKTCFVWLNFINIWIWKELKMNTFNSCKRWMGMTYIHSKMFCWLKVKFQITWQFMFLYDAEFLISSCFSHSIKQIHLALLSILLKRTLTSVRGA